MHHFRETVRFSMSSLQDGKCNSLWPEQLLSLASGCDFVMQSVLAVSALHLCFLHSTSAQKYSTLAYYYSNGASRRFRESVKDISPANYLETVVFSVQCAIFALTEPFVLGWAIGRKGEVLSVFDPSEVLKLLRTISKIAPMLERVISTANHPDLFKSEMYQEQMHQLETIKAQTLFSLRVFYRGTPLKVYRTAIRTLERWILSLPQGVIAWRGLMGWPSTLNDDYIQRLEASCPEAMAILQHWCIILQHLVSQWYLSPWLDKVLCSKATENCRTPLLPDSSEALC